MNTNQSLASTITKTTKVRDALEYLRSEPTIVKASDDLLSIAEKVGLSPGTRTVAVVDAEEALIGIIHVSRFCDYVFLRIMPEEFMREILDSKAMIELARESEIRTAQDAMAEPVYVTIEDTVRDAFAKMHKHRLSGLPVVDEAKRVVGYLDMLQLLRVWLRAQGR